MFKRIGMLVLGLVFAITLTPFSAQGTDRLSKNGESTEPDGATKIRISETYGKLPLHFEANQGQVDQRVRFLSRGSGYNLLLTSNEAVLTLSRRENDNNRNRATERNSRERGGEGLIPTGTLWMRWEGANEEAKIEGVEGLDGKSHYFIGNDPKKWRSNVSLYRKVRYRDLYPGVDLIYYGNQRQLEYDLIVMPEGDPNAIRLAIEGAEEVRVNEGGDLVVKISGGEVIQHKPLIYQETEGKREIIRGGYVVDSLGKQDEKAKVRISFKIDHFDREKPLIIDPYLVYSTYLGGWSTDSANAIAVDDSGNAYITGMTLSPDFPTINPIQGLNGNADAFVAKLNPSGTALVYSTYLGGANSLNATNDGATGIAVDSSGNAYITGNTCSTDFPTLNPIQAVYGGGITDGFVTKLDPSGSALVYSTYLGGNGNDSGSGIVVDSSGNAYITGGTQSTNFPTLNPIQPSNAGGKDAFVTKLSSSGALVYSTYLGGSDSDLGTSIAVDSSGSAYITGETYSLNFPTKNPIQASLGGLDSDAFITKLNPSGTALVYSTFLGGRYGLDYDIDYGMGIAVDDSGSAYVVGSTWCSDFPTVNPIQGSNAGSRDVFVAKLNPAGTALVYSTYLGGSNNDEGNGIALDGTGSPYITGYTKSTDFPTLNATQGTYGGGDWDAFVAKLNPSGSALVYSTYLGGNGTEYGFGIAADSSGAAYVAGATSSNNFPTVNPIQGSRAGGNDAFVTKIDSGIPTLSVTPTDGLTSSGIQGGPFTPSSKDYMLQNMGGASINWTASKVQTWTTLSSTSGTLAAGTSTTVTVSINSGANSLSPGSWSDTVSFTNTTNGNGNTTRPVSLTVIPPGALSVTPADGLTSSGIQGGPFTPSSKAYTLQNIGSSSINWMASNGQSWDTLSSTSGTLTAGTSTTLTVSINANANALAPGSYSDTVSFTNTTNGNGNTTRPVSLTVNSLPGVLSVTPLDGLTSSGNQGGPFSPPNKNYTLQNTGGSSISWTASKGQSWDTLSSTGGTLGAGASTTVTVSINTGANSLIPGSYADIVTFTNSTNNNGNTTRGVSLTVIPRISWTSIPGEILSSPALAWNPVAQKIQMVVRGGGNSIWTGTFNSSGTFNNDWTQIPGAILDPPALAWNPVAQEMQMVVRGGGDSMWAASFNSSGVFNNDWTHISGSTPSPPALAWNAVAQKMQMVVRGGGDTIWAGTFNSSGTFNYDWTQIPGAILDPAALAWNPVAQKTQMVVRGGGDSIWAASFSSSGVFNYDWAFIPGSMPSFPALAWNTGTQKMQMVVRGGGNTIWAATFESNGTFNYDWTQILGSTPSSPAVVYLPSGYMVIVVRGSDNSIWRGLY